MAEFEGPPGEVDEVAAHVTGNTVSKVPTAVPVEVSAFPVSLIVSALRCGAEPDIPIDKIGHGLGFKDGFTNGSDAAVAPDVGFSNFANRSSLDEFDCSAVVGSGVNLGAHLGCDFSFLLGIFLLHPPCFLHGVGEGFFAIDVFTGAHCRDRCRGVVVVGGADDDGIDLRIGDDFTPISGGFGVLKTRLN